MSGFRQILLGILVVFLAGLIIFGAFTLSVRERRQSPAQQAGQTQEATPTSSPSVAQKQTATPSITPAPSDVFPLTDTVEAPTASAPATEAPMDGTPVSAGGEEDYSYRSLLPGAFMEEPNISSLVIIQEQPTEVSPTATEQAKTRKSKSCSRPRGWSAYTVRRGDTISRLSQRSGVSVAQIKKANCMGASNKLKAGKTLYLPRVSYTPYMAPPMGCPMPPPSWYYRPSRNPQSVLPTQPIVIITMPPGSPNAALPASNEPPLIDRAFNGNLVYNATRF
jgi:hypothetical protein